MKLYDCWRHPDRYNDALEQLENTFMGGWTTFGTLRPCHNRQIHIDESISTCWKNPLRGPTYLTRQTLCREHFFPSVIN
jgi:hypothetical protein